MSNRIKIIADDKIPFLKGVLESSADIQYLNPPDITNNEIKDKDSLIIRTRTKCNSDLLDGTKIKLIATATIGIDHIDTDYCERKGIKWINAPGCNSSSVRQYVASAILTIAFKKKLNLNDMTIGIIGVGNVGSKIKSFAKTLGLKVLLNDPPRVRKEGSSGFVTIDELISGSDIITFHVPLIKKGEDKTLHMADQNFFSKFNNSKWIINTSRGPVIETNSLKEAIKKKVVTTTVLDVWENEPWINEELLNMADIATPHIAGYSADGKANGTSVCVRNISSFFNLGIDEEWYPKEIPAPSNSSEIYINCEKQSLHDILYNAVISSYNIMNDDNILRNSADTFEKQRGNYPVRREFSFYKIKAKDCPDESESRTKRIRFSNN